MTWANATILTWFESRTMCYLWVEFVLFLVPILWVFQYFFLSQENQHFYAVNSPFASCSQACKSKRGLGHKNAYGNEINLQVNEISFSYERMRIKTRFEKEARGNPEISSSLYFRYE